MNKKSFFVEQFRIRKCAMDKEEEKSETVCEQCILYEVCTRKSTSP